MAVNLAALWSYAGVSMREDEGGWADANRMKFLKERGWGYVSLLLGDGRTERNRNHADAIVREADRNGMAVVGWFTPRPTHGIPIAETVAMAKDCVDRYGIDGIRYQTEAEFEYSNPAEGGTPAERFGAMSELGQEHRKLLPTIPTCVFSRVGLNLADAWWAMAWKYKMRCSVECYGPTEGVTHPAWGAPAAAGSAGPPLVGGWWYRVKLGSVIEMGRLSDDGRSIVVSGYGDFPVGSSAGPRQISRFGDPKWGSVYGFFPTTWLKITVPSYAGAIGSKPSGATLAREIRDWQATVRKFGPATKGFSVYVGPEMTADHFAHISPSVLTGAALLP